MINTRLKAHILKVVDNQLKMNDPIITKETLNRLMGLGYSKEDAKEMIASVLVEEIHDVMKENQPYDEERYSKRLALLPEHTETAQDTSTNLETILPARHEPKLGRNIPCPCGSGEKYKNCCGS